MKHPIGPLAGADKSFVEVDIDFADTQESTPTPGGACLHVTSSSAAVDGP